MDKSMDVSILLGWRRAEAGTLERFGSSNMEGSWLVIQSISFAFLRSCTNAKDRVHHFEPAHKIVVLEGFLSVAKRS